MRDILRDGAGNVWRNPLQAWRSEEIYQNREALGGTGRFDRIAKASFEKERKLENTSNQTAAHRNNNKNLNTT